MANKNIKDLTKVTTLNDTDALEVDTGAASQYIEKSDLTTQILTTPAITGKATIASSNSSNGLLLTQTGDTGTGTTNAALCVFNDANARTALKVFSDTSSSSGSYLMEVDHNGTSTQGGLNINMNNASATALKVARGRINLTLPTSASGLNSGDLWNDGGTLKIA